MTNQELANKLRKNIEELNSFLKECKDREIDVFIEDTSAYGFTHISEPPVVLHNSSKVEVQHIAKHEVKVEEY